MKQSNIDSFWQRVEKVELTGCWLWTSRITKNGYGTWSYTDDGKTCTDYVHRLAYELLVGPIPDGLVLDHLCKVRFCCAPAHLEPVPQKENVRRGRAAKPNAVRQPRPTHCPQGHEHNDESTLVRASGQRDCRVCTRERMRARRESLPRKPRPRKSHCVHGHELTPENVIVYSSGRACRECARRRVREMRAQKRSEQPPPPVRTECKNGHALIGDNVYINPNRPGRNCRRCHAERTLAAYHARKGQAASMTGEPASTAVQGGLSALPEGVNTWSG